MNTINSLENELELFLKILDQKIDSIKLGLDQCQKLLDETIDSAKKIQEVISADYKIKCQFCDEEAIKDALDEDGNTIKICENCDSKKENK